jgi:hypothetical protein
MNRSMRLVVVMTFAVAACAGSQASKTDASSSGMMGAQTFHATMSAANEVPQPNLGSSTPSCTATFESNGQTLTYKVDAHGLTSPFTAAHIHVGAPGVAGPVVAPLNMTDSGNGTASGSGTIEPSDIKGKNPDGSPMSMKDVLTLLGSGNAYVNVHTQNNKPGECRGQIEPAR